MSREDPYNEGRAAARARRFRNIAIALLLAAFVAAVFAVTVVRMGQNAPGPDAHPVVG